MVAPVLTEPRPVPLLRLDTMAGLAVALLGATTMLGWLPHVPALPALRHGLVPMVFNTGLGFFLAGSALLLPRWRGEDARPARTLIAALLIGLCGLTLIEILLDRSIAGIDLAFLHEWYDYGNKCPGRMAPNTAIGFITIACAILGADRLVKALGIGASRTTAGDIEAYIQTLLP